MKKLLIGCLIFVVLVIAVVAGLGWYGYTKLKGFAEGYNQAFVQMQQMDQDFPWSQPATGTALQPTRFDQYLSVRTRINDRLMSVALFSELAKAAEEDRQANVTTMQVLGLVAEVPNVIKDTVGAFREQQMGFREFGYFSFESLRAIRAGAEAQDPEMATLWEKLRGMATAMDTVLNSQGNSSNIDISGSFDTLSAVDVAPETVVLVRSNLSEFKDSPSRYVVELIFVRLLDEFSKNQPAATSSE
jgi:hypothetical protein